MVTGFRDHVGMLTYQSDCSGHDNDHDARCRHVRCWKNSNAIAMAVYWKGGDSVRRSR